VLRQQLQLQNRPLLVLANKQDLPNASHMYVLLCAMSLITCSVALRSRGAYALPPIVCSLAVLLRHSFL
jgi:hypothetical protein